MCYAMCTSKCVTLCVHLNVLRYVYISTCYDMCTSKCVTLCVHLNMLRYVYISMCYDMCTSQCVMICVWYTSHKAFGQQHSHRFSMFSFKGLNLIVMMGGLLLVTNVLKWLTIQRIMPMPRPTVNRRVEIFLQFSVNNNKHFLAVSRSRDWKSLQTHW